MSPTSPASKDVARCYRLAALTDLATGVSPVGALVILDTRERGVVSQVNPDPDLFHRPTVRVISDAMGVPLAEPLSVDLAKVDPATGVRRTIVKTTDPQKYGIRVSDYLLA